jgi:hypothetical protein
MPPRQLKSLERMHWASLMPYRNSMVLPTPKYSWALMASPPMSITSWKNRGRPPSGRSFTFPYKIVYKAVSFNSFFFCIYATPLQYQGVTKRCRLYSLTNSALVIRVQMRGRGEVAGSQPMTTAVHITCHGAQKSFGDLPPYLTYEQYL